MQRPLWPHFFEASIVSRKHSQVLKKRSLVPLDLVKVRKLKGILNTSLYLDGQCKCEHLLNELITMDAIKRYRLPLDRPTTRYDCIRNSYLIIEFKVLFGKVGDKDGNRRMVNLLIHEIRDS